MPEEITTIEKDGAGRPCKYESHVQPRLGEVLDWLKKGYTDYSIADTLGVGYSTWMKYKAEILELQDVYTRARTHRNNLVMNAQFGKAVGIEKTVPKAFKIKEVKYDDKGHKQSEIERLEYGTETIFVPPDVNAADLYLRNNDPEYKQAKQVESGQTINVNFQLPQIEQELQQIADQRKALEMQLGVDFKRIE